MPDMIRDMPAPYSSLKDMFSFMRHESPMALGSSLTLFTSLTAMTAFTSVTA
jgi:hypothetical protein